MRLLRMREEYLRFLILIGFIIFLLVLFTIINPVFLNLGNLMNLVSQAAVLAILAIGMSLIIISGGIDLSIGSNIAFSGAIAAVILKYTDNAFLSIIAALIGGSLIGLLNGIMVGKFKIAPFIATLSTLVLARGLAIGITNANAIRIFNTKLLWLGQAKLGPIPIIFFVIIILYFLFFEFSKFSVFCRYIYAIGGNSIAAKVAGINIDKQIVIIYMFNGLMVGLASIVTIGRLSSIQPWSGLGVEFEVITAVILGGISLLGGEGSIIGTLLGAILIGALGNGLMLVNIPNYYLDVVRGVVLISAVTFDKKFLQYFLQIEKRNFLKRVK